MRRSHAVVISLAAAQFVTGAFAAATVTPAASAGANVPAPPAAGGPVATSGRVPAWAPEPRVFVPLDAPSPVRAMVAEGEAASRALPYEHPAVLFVGDSITQFWRTNGVASWNRWFAPLGAGDDGVAGDTTSNLLARIDAGQVPATPPRTIVLMIGTNNIAAGESPAEVTKGIWAVVAALHSRMPSSRIILLGLLPRGSPADPARTATATVNQSLGRTFGGTGVDYLDVGRVLLRSDARLVPGSMLPDLLHPSALGYALIAGPILRELRATD